MPNVSDKYKVFVNGRFTSSGNNYDEVFQRGLGIAMHLGLDFINPRSVGNKGSFRVVDKWVNNPRTHVVLVTSES